MSHHYKLIATDGSLSKFYGDVTVMPPAEVAEWEATPFIKLPTALILPKSPKRCPACEARRPVLGDAVQHIARWHGNWIADVQQIRGECHRCGFSWHVQAAFAKTKKVKDECSAGGAIFLLFLVFLIIVGIAALSGLALGLVHIGPQVAPVLPTPIDAVGRVYLVKTGTFTGYYQATVACEPLSGLHEMFSISAAYGATPAEAKRFTEPLAKMYNLKIVWKGDMP